MHSTQQIQLGCQQIDYRLSRSQRRTLGLTIDARGLRVAAPHQVSMAEVERFIALHAAWVLKKLAHWQPAADTTFALDEGATLPVLGVPWTLRLAAGQTRLHWLEHSQEMMLFVRANANPRDALRRHLQAHALDVFLSRAVHFESALRQPLPPIALSSARTRWGSCSSKTGVRLNWRLIHLPMPQIDYVIAHEFAHLAHMNHSPRFWAEVARLYPGFETARAALKREGRNIPQI